MSKLTTNQWKSLCYEHIHEIKSCMLEALRTSYENRNETQVVLFSDGDVHIYENTSGREYPTGDYILLISFTNFEGTPFDHLYTERHTLDILLSYMCEVEKKKYAIWNDLRFKRTLRERIEWIKSNCKCAYGKAFDIAIMEEFYQLNIDTYLSTLVEDYAEYEFLYSE